LPALPSARNVPRNHREGRHGSLAQGPHRPGHRGRRGIGRAIALSLAEAGADVAVNFRRDEGAAQQTVKDIQAKGRKAKAYSASVENWTRT